MLRITRQNYVCLIAGFLALLLLAPGIAAQEDEPWKRIDPKAEEVLRGFSDHLAKLTSFTVDVSAYAVLSSGKRAAKNAATYSVTVVRPNRVAIVCGGAAELSQAAAKFERDIIAAHLGYIQETDRFQPAFVLGNPSGNRIVSDGRLVTVYWASQKEYMKSNAPEALVDLISDINVALVMGEVIHCDFLFHPSAVESLLREASGASYLGTEPIQSIECHHLRFVRSKIRYDLWISSGPKVELLKLKVDASRVFADALGERSSSLTRVGDRELDFKNWVENVELEADHFRFTPPKDAKQVDSFIGKLVQELEDHRKDFEKRMRQAWDEALQQDSKPPPPPSR